MAAITSATLDYVNADPNVRVALLSVRRVTTGDTIDVSAVPSALFSRVISATYSCVTNSAIASANATIAGTVLTFAQSGLAGDGVALLVVGEAPQ